MDLAESTKLAALAVAIEAFVGYPQDLFDVIGHPVSWIGRLLAASERILNRDTRSYAGRFALGAAALTIILLIVAMGAILIVFVASVLPQPLQLALTACLASSLIAQRSLEDHVLAVAEGLGKDVAEARAAVAKIVGRDVDGLDAAGIASAAIESLAENFSDGVVAPAFWLAVGGLPGGLCYKAINTADSMIGHLTERHAAFGFASAKLDDFVNYFPARLSALVVVMASLFARGASIKNVLGTLRRDARGHPSPNAGWPEAAFAGVLGLRLGGPRSYGNIQVDDGWIGTGSKPCAGDIERALALYRRACIVHWLVLATITLAIARA